MSKTKPLMIASALFLVLCAFAVSFAPGELLELFDLSAEPPLPAILKLMGGLYLGFALLNWTAKGSRIGGIYSRPISVGNFLHFFVGSLSLLKQQITEGADAVLLAVLALYVIFAALFGWLVFGQGPACAGAPGEPAQRA